jgi:hypothetical protein
VTRIADPLVNQEVCYISACRTQVIRLLCGGCGVSYAVAPCVFYICVCIA